MIDLCAARSRIFQIRLAVCGKIYPLRREVVYAVS